VVYGVFDESGQRWIQLSLDGTHHAVLTLRLRPSQKPREAVRELSTWLADPSASQNVLQRVA
jgi:hypothetical protein